MIRMTSLLASAAACDSRLRRAFCDSVTGARTRVGDLATVV